MTTTSSDEEPEDILGKILARATDEIESTKEATDHYILNFFGSIEMVKKHAHEYVIEESPLELEQIEMEGFGDDNISLRMSQTFKLRRKTEEEMRQIEE